MIMIDEVRDLLEKYNDWLKSKTALRQLDKDWVEITTPYLDRHNDYMQIYVKKNEKDFVLTDDGYIIRELSNSGVKLDSKKRQDLLKMTLNGFGVQLNNQKLEVHTSNDNFALRKHSLAQAMLAVNDMFYTAYPIVASLFFEDVTEWLDLKDIRYTQNVTFTGKSGLDNLFNFVIPKSKYYPERIIQTINNPNRNNATAMAFSWIDTKDVRPYNSKAYAFLNDSEKTISSSVLEVLKNYEVSPVLWSRREDIAKEISA